MSSNGFTHRAKIIGALATIIFVCIILLLIPQREHPISYPTIEPSAALLYPTPTPYPFYELTIPYLRTKTYSSKLGELTQISKNTSYTSYLTSYDSDSFAIQGLLTIPQTPQPPQGYPAIIFIHGYIPPAQYRTTEKYVSYVDYLARNGFVVFKIDLRGHGDSEGEAGGAYYSSDYIIDTLNAREALRSDNRIDDANIGLWGHSMAGNVIVRTLAVDPTIPAAVIWAGAGYTYTDLSEYRISDVSYIPPPNSSRLQKKRDELFRLYGRPLEGNSFWDQVKATQYMQEFQTPIQIHHAENDSVVSILYSRNFSSLLKNAAIAHEFYEYEGGGHNIEQPYFSQAMQRTIQFFNKYLY